MRARGAVAALAAAALLGAMFLDWYSNSEAIALLEMLREMADPGADFPIEESDINISAWETSGFGTIATLLLALCGAAAIGAGLSLALRGGLAERRDIARDLASVLLVAGGLATGVIIYRLIDKPVEPLVGTLSVEPGLYIGLAAAIVLGVSGLLAMFAARGAGRPSAASEGEG